MNARHQFHDAQGYVAITLEGRVTLPELGAHVQTVWSDPGWKPSYNGLLDCANAFLDIREAELQELMKAMAKDPRCSMGKWAIVVSTSVAFAKMRKADDVVDPKATLRIFFDRMSAEAWLLSK